MGCSHQGTVLLAFALVVSVVLGQEQRRMLRQEQQPQDKAGITLDLPGVSITIGDSTSSSTSSSRNSTSEDSTTNPINYSDYVRSHHFRASDDGSEAVCAMQQEMDDDGSLCVAAASWLALTKLAPPQLGLGMRSKEPLNPNNTLPATLQDLRTMPATVDPDVVTVEKPTFYWYYRLLQNFQAVMQVWRPALGEDPDLAMPLEWQHERFYNTSAGDDGTVPMGASYVKDDHMVLIFRATIYSEEWVHNFNYGWAPNTSAFPVGHVHAGFYEIFDQMVDDVVDEVRARKPKRVTVTGHSLGGAVSNLFGYFLAIKNATRTPVEVVSFAAPQVGDADFAADFNKQVNSRHVSFKGTGSRGDSYNVGDFISQVPCGTVRRCPLLDEFSSTSVSSVDDKETYTYTAVGGDVPFLWSDLKNADTWKYKSDVTSFFYAPVANHMCSYSCFLAPSVGDKEDRCFFPLDWEPDVLLKDRCNFLM